MEKTVNIIDLTCPCVTRARGKEATDKLKYYLEATSGALEINLSNVEFISMSFLDEVIFNLLQPVRQGRVVFSTDNTVTLHKLSKIASIRSVSILCKDERGIHPIVAQSVSTPHIVHAVAKN